MNWMMEMYSHSVSGDFHKKLKETWRQGVVFLVKIHLWHLCVKQKQHICASFLSVNICFT